MMSVRFSQDYLRWTYTKSDYLLIQAYEVGNKRVDRAEDPMVSLKRLETLYACQLFVL